MTDVFRKVFHRRQCSVILQSSRMASASTNVNVSKDVDEKISVRAGRRKKALGHYMKKHGEKKKYVLDEDLERETSYYIENGLRKVYPYYYKFKTFVKGRWIGRTILDIYTQEFAKHMEGKHKEAIECGNITVNGKKVPIDLKLENNMLIEYICHRHEMPVLADPIEIIEDTDDILVINKPSSIPVHPCGRYRYNSMTMLLKHEFGYDNLRTLYRIDRLTSGLLIMPKTTSMSKKLEKQLDQKELQKEYICRVVGKFPDEEVVCNEALSCMSHKIGLYRRDPEGKPSCTKFYRLSYNGKTSVVKCVPVTGRTHQIRVHLQFLGYPICNDPLYNNKAFGPNKGKGGAMERPLEEIEADIFKTSNVGRWRLGENPRYLAKFAAASSGNQTINEQKINIDSATLKDVPMKTKVIPESVTSFDVQSSETRPEGTGVVSGEVDVKQEAENCELGRTPNNNEKSENSNEELPRKRIKLDSEGHQGGLNGERSGDVKGNENTEGEANVMSTVQKNDTSEARDPEMQELEQCQKSKDIHVHSNVPSKRVTDPMFIESKLTIDENCEDCRFIFQDPDRNELTLYLHAVRYKGPDWEYNTTLPYWASEDFSDEDIWK